jgi:PKD repeat protein
MGQGWINKYYWYFGDGTMDSSNTYVFNKKYSTAGNYVVTLVAVGSEGCRDTMSMFVQVRELPCTGTLKFVNLQDGTNWKLDPKLGDGGILSSVNKVENEMSYGMYPNPNNGVFTLKFNEVIHEPISIQVLDVLGKVVYSKKVDHLGSKEIAIETEGLSEGTFMLFINSDARAFSEKKFVVFR